MSRLIVLTIALAASACATHVRSAQPTAPARYNLCTDHGFECVPTKFEPSIQVDTNLAAPASKTVTSQS
jgi:hypothetical protein